MVRAAGIAPASTVWKTVVLLLNDASVGEERERRPRRGFAKTYGDPGPRSELAAGTLENARALSRSPRAAAVARSRARSPLRHRYVGRPTIATLGPL